MISIIITAWKEEKTIAKALRAILNDQLTNDQKKVEILVVCPDDESWIAAKKEADKHSFTNIRRIKDPKKGKPFALNMAFNEAKGDILVLTDGDVYFGDNVISKLLPYFKDEKIGGVTGRPVSQNRKDNFMGYMGHLLADAAHHKRMVTMRPDAKGKSLRIVSKSPGFFVMSGYIFAMRNLGIKAPEDCLIEDAYFSYEVHNKDYELAYEPEAKAYVKYATTLKDWFKQKLRSVGGYVQLWKYNVIKPTTKVRNFWKELEYFWFPIKYAQNIKEFFWSLLIYPIRMYLWLKIFYEQRILKKNFEKTWVRIESTK